MKKKNKISRKWIKQTLFATLATLFFVILVNYINDPLWIFNHKNFTNKFQTSFNERQQKTNLIYFGKHDYDSILLGNSKSTYINQNKFELGKLFNYSVSAMHISEYEGYIDFFKKVIGKEPKYIVLGLDFTACFQNIGENDEINIHKTEGFDIYENPQFYINNTTSNFYKFKHLLSYDTFIYSIRNFTMSLDKKRAVYDHENVKVKLGFEQIKEKNLQKKLGEIIKNPPSTLQDTIYHKSSVKILQKIKENNSESKFIVILLPDYMPIFTINDKKPIYDKCIDDLGQIFGRKNIFNFMQLNEMTVDSSNYYDGSHFRNYIGDFIMKEISK